MATSAQEIVVVDDQLSVRRGTELVLREAGLRIVGTAAGGEEAAALLRRRRFDVALVEAMLDGVPTAPLLGELFAERPEAAIVIHAGRDEEALLAAAAVGAPGLVLKSSAPSVLLEGLRTVMDGERFVDPGVARRLPAGRARPARRGVAQLSPREREILSLLAHGRSGSQIADELFLSSETVRTHVRNAVHKLGAHTRTQAVALLVDHEGGLPDGVRMD